MVIKIFASIGVIATFIVGISLLVFIEEFIENVEDLIERAVNNRKYKKQLKSRFEGGPTAKCFCKDCKYYYEKIKDTKYDSSTGECVAHNWLGVRDNYYCWAATPLDYDEAKRREEIEKGK